MAAGSKGQFMRDNIIDMYPYRTCTRTAGPDKKLKQVTLNKGLVLPGVFPHWPCEQPMAHNKTVDNARWTLITSLC